LKKNQNDSEIIKKLEEENKEYLLGWQRALADYKNLQEASSAARQEAAHFGEEKILFEIMPVLNNFGKAVASQEQIMIEIKENLSDNENLLKKVNNWAMGVQYINKQFTDLLNELEVEAIKTVGEFDPRYHDAIESENNPDFADNEIIKELQPGYLFKGKVLTPAKVIVNHLAEEK
jgi:molecular chaperone GrpE